MKLKYLKKEIRVIGIDFSKNEGEHAKKRLLLIEAVAEMSNYAARIRDTEKFSNLHNSVTSLRDKLTFKYDL